jgi:peroxiredoxin
MEESTAPEKAEADNEGGSTEPGTGGSESTTAEEVSGETAADARPVIPAVDFELEDQYGNIHRLEDYRGKTIFLNFWATWCSPCRGELPYLKEAFKEFGPKGFNIYGVSLDNDAESWKEFLVKEEMTWPNVIAVTDGKSAPIVEEYGIRSIPTNFLISPEGKIVAKDLRGEGIKEKLAELVK